MTKFIKAISYFFVIAVSFYVIVLWYQMYIVGQYYKAAGIFLNLFGATAPFWIIWLSYLVLVELRKYFKNFKN